MEYMNYSFGGSLCFFSHGNNLMLDSDILEAQPQIASLIQNMKSSYSEYYFSQTCVTFFPQLLNENIKVKILNFSFWKSALMDTLALP